jgi:hypothetical protein
MYIFFYFIRKDARLPVQLQRAMAAEAEAAREARAKVKTTFGTSFKLYTFLLNVRSPVLEFLNNLRGLGTE